MTVGGDAINEATILTRLGHTVRLVSAVGQDPAGSFVLEHCRKNKIDSSFLAVSGTLTTSINVPLISPDGERSVITNRSGSLWQLCLDDLDLSCLEEGSVLSFASIFNNPRLDQPAMLEIFRRAKERGMTICADMVSPRFAEKVDDIRQALAYVDYFFPNYDEACELTGLTELDGAWYVFQPDGSLFPFVHGLNDCNGILYYHTGEDGFGSTHQRPDCTTTAKRSILCRMTGHCSKTGARVISPSAQTAAIPAEARSWTRASGSCFRTVPRTPARTARRAAARCSRSLACRSISAAQGCCRR